MVKLIWNAKSAGLSDVNGGVKAGQRGGIAIG
jgi:hypothetical protein